MGELQMKIIGLTGGIACGKTTVASMLKELGASIVDADQISRELTMPAGEALPALREAFGTLVFYPDGTLNRPVLAQLVFHNREELEKLNSITHPMIHQKLLAEIETCRKMGALVVVLDVPLLFEAGVQALADVIVCASAPEERQIERLTTRSGLTREQALSRIHSQWPLAEKEKRSDIVLDTDQPLNQLEAEVQKLYNGWISA
ncbi:MAG: dephospho-CoA kinase [Clostridia bacterium]